MSSYEDLGDAGKLIASTHFPQKMGPHFDALLRAIQHQMNELAGAMIEVVKDSFQVDNALGADMDLVAGIFSITRLTEETDDDLRQRVIEHVPNFDVLTAEAIINMFERITGRRPYFDEDFDTEVHRGTSVPTSPKVAMFKLFFELPRTIVHEEHLLPINKSWIEVRHETIVNAQTALLSTNVSTSTTVMAVDSLDNFPADGSDYERAIRIEDEWVSYGSIDTGSDEFIDCVRGIWGSIPATHATSVQVTEAVPNIRLRGSVDPIYDSNDGNIIYFTGAPYTEWIYADVIYKIPSDGVDNLEELTTKMDQLVALGQDYKAAGIIAEIGIATLLRSWFQDVMEGIVMVDELNTRTGLHNEVETLTPPSEEGYICEALFQFGHFGHSYWGDVRFTDNYRLEMDVSSGTPE